MRKLHILAILAVVFMAASCGSTMESQLIGSWSLDKAEIVNLDSVVRVKESDYTRELHKSIDNIQSEIDSAKSDAKRRELQSKKRRFEDDLNLYTFVNIKQEYEDLLKDMQGNMTFIFAEEGKLSLKVTYPETSVNTGQWKVKADTIFTLFDNQPSETMIVRSVSSGNLEIYSPAVDANSVDLNLFFVKK